MTEERPIYGLKPKRINGNLYLWVLLAIFCGAVFGYLDSQHAVALKPLADGFISLIKMLIAPVIFCTVVLGIAGAHDMQMAGRVGVKALLYFEIVSTFALGLGVLIANFSSLAKGSMSTPLRWTPRPWRVTPNRRLNKVWSIFC
jgi:aerobic C4-dicarboxylate transport protein